MTLALPVPVDRYTAERDREEGWWMWLSFGWALTSQRASHIDRHLYAAFVAYRQLSFGMQDLFKDAFRMAYAAGVARRTLLEHEMELDYTRRMIGECEAEVSRCQGKAELVGSHLCALEELARWRRRLEVLELDPLTEQVAELREEVCQ
jgi:hypothetical protein